MFNFTGDTKRRNINLGSKTRTSKRDLLAKAERERIRRAEERRDNSAALLIQRNIRKQLAIRYFFQNEYPDFSKNLMNDTPDRDIHLFPVFGKQLLNFIPLEQLKRLLNKYRSHYSNYPCRLINDKSLYLLVAHCQPDILEECLGLINFKELRDGFLLSTALLNLMKDNREFDFLSNDYIYTFFKTLRDQSSSYVLATTIPIIFSVQLDTRFESKSVDTLMILFASLKLLPDIDEMMPQSELQTIFLHLCYLHTVEDLDMEYIEEKIFQLLQYYRDLDDTNIHYFQGLRVSELFESSFTLKLINEVVSGHVPLSALILSLQICGSQKVRYENELLVLYLGNKELCTKTFDSLFQNTTKFGVMEPGMDSLRLSIELLKFHLLLTNDSELFRVQATIAIPTIRKFSILLKDFIFDSLWQRPLSDRDTTIDKAIDLLKNIYVRDSRIHFCSGKEDTKFWTIDDDIFKRTTIYKLLDEFNSVYKKDVQFDNHYSDLTQVISEERKDAKSQLMEQMISNWSNRNIPEKLIKKFEILMRVPFFIHFNDRIEIFYMLINIDRQDLGIDSTNRNMVMMNAFLPQGGSNKWTATISRDNILGDAMSAYDNKGEAFKSGLQVQFINEFGPEEGIDGGGVTKEFLTSVANEGFKDSKYDLFMANEQYQLYPKPTRDPQKLEQLSFLGKIVGKCLYEHILIDIDFAPFFLKKLLNYSNSFKSTFDDLATLDSTLYSSLTKLARVTDPETVESMDLRLEITDPDDPNKTIELVSGGSSIKVLPRTLLKYIFLIAKYKLDSSLYSAVTAFHNGLSIMIPPIWLEMFNPEELEMLISGGKKDINIEELKQNTEYGGYEPTDKTITFFWEILKEMTSEERCDLLKFVTSVPKAPLQGFKTLDPKFGIRNAGNDITRLPTASTCVNLLKLPDYRDKETLREKLLYSIHSGARFDLS
ncbi:hypothetical protein C6P45_000476 [Maudiozyma exigua]|uniref:HECT-type E3 ubiquitin transferase n=1 Tax=Maudiozyma exigua TaxID=34358 RepID=A0A9P7B981_MAUEX|nr:hypothetical protein C6P45_000476 [Kazachstania exigua]